MPNLRQLLWKLWGEDVATGEDLCSRLAASQGQPSGRDQACLYGPDNICSGECRLNQMRRAAVQRS
jgi:hypothetical protein